MGGLFGVCLRNACVTDLFFGTDYHSHLGTHRGGIAVYDGQHFTRAIHNIENAPFRTKFEADIPDMKGMVGIGCISDTHPQPIVLNSKIGTFAVVTVGRINNKKKLAEQLQSEDNLYFSELSGGRINDTELAAALLSRKDSIPEGIAHVQDVVEGSMTMLVCADGGLYAARDKLGRTPLSVGKKEDGHCVSFESFAFINLDYSPCYELGPGEIVFVTADTITTVKKPGGETRMCSFMWAYFGYPTSDYEGVNVEDMRYRNGANLSREDKLSGIGLDIDHVAGIPDSGTAHAIGYANCSGIPFARPLIKYTPTWPRSFTPQDQTMRNLIARMKLIPVNSLIKNKRLLFIDDSIVRCTQIRGVIDFLHTHGAKELHIRSSCPPILFGCQYLNFSRLASENDLISRKMIHMLEGDDGEKHLHEYTDPGTKRYNNMVDRVRQSLNLTTLGYHSLDGLLDSIGIDRCKLCTYCWNGEDCEAK